MINSLKVQSALCVVPIGLLHMGSARHRALLYKVLASDLGLPCRVTKSRCVPGAGRQAAVLASLWWGTRRRGGCQVCQRRATGCSAALDAPQCEKLVAARCGRFIRRPPRLRFLPRLLGCRPGL